jgi:hypothetical protein
MNAEPEQPQVIPSERPPLAADAGAQTNQNVWWKSVAFWISISSLICTVYSASNTSRSADAATRSADAAAMSARAALTNADWVSYQRNPHHELRARVLRVGTVIRGWSEEDTNGLAYIDLALLNDGNQSELVRRVAIYYDSDELKDGGPVSHKILNSVLVKGDRQVLHLLLDHQSVFTGKDVWLKLGVVAIGPDAEDLESKFLVAKFTLAVDGNGGQYSPYPTNAIRVISNERLPHQKVPDTPFF